MEHVESVALAPFPSSVTTPGGRTGVAAWKGVAASLLLHLFVGAAAIGAISTTPSVPPPVIDLTLAGPAGEVPANTIGSEAARVRTARVLDTGIRPDEAPAPVQALPATSTFTAAEPAKDPGTVPIPESSAPPVAPTIANRPVGIPPGNLSDPAAKKSSWVTDLSGSLPAAPVSPASPVVTGGSPQSVVPNARAATAEGSGKATTGDPSGKTVPGRPAGDFAGIRDGIQRGITYPAMARKMGWEGKVVVAFRVLPDGTVRNVRVVQGSGHAALDRGAVEAVRSASPFPRPPAEAEIITPVVYRLNGVP